MMTGSVFVGSCVTGEITCAPVPGILNAILFGPLPANELASSSACRNEPGPASFVFTTVSVSGGSVVGAAKHGENSDVLLFVSVAVAVRYLPVAATVMVRLKVALPPASVATF